MIIWWRMLTAHLSVTALRVGRACRHVDTSSTHSPSTCPHKQARSTRGLALDVAQAIPTH